MLCLGESLSRAVLMKNYASLDKNEIQFHVFFLKLLPIKVLQKFCTYLKESKGELKPTKASLPCQVCPTASSSKLNPAG
jgi:hypothetical protein